MGTPFLVKWKMAVVRGNLFACSRWRSWLCGLGPLYSCGTSKWMLLFQLCQFLSCYHENWASFCTVSSMSKSADWKKWIWQFGEVLATTEHAEDIIIAEIDYSILELRRWCDFATHQIVLLHKNLVKCLFICILPLIKCQLKIQDKPSIIKAKARWSLPVGWHSKA